MSEGDDNVRHALTLTLIAMLVLAAVVVFIWVVSTSEIRDLQRRVGQLEQRVQR